MRRLFLNTMFLMAMLMLLTVLDLLVGTVNILENRVDVYTVLMDLRVPKTLTAIAVGSTLSLCGLVLQILFRNPLAGPYVLGISSAASLFMAVGIMSTGLLSTVIWYDIGLNAFAVLGAIFGILIILLVLKITSQVTVVLLIGLMLSQLYGAVQSILSYLSPEHALKIYTLWTMGSIQNADTGQSVMMICLSAIGWMWISLHTKFLTAYVTGDENAMVMGMNLHKTRRHLILTVAVLVGIITAYCGPIAFVGMSIPVLVRILNKNADVYRWIKHSYLYGALFVLATDVVNQIVFDGSVPLNILISLWGVPLMVWILVKQMKWVMV
ncbi:MAG: iron ABC transporter [Bacteroidia bacterium]|nr:MAG: iron ABC transporter [Bacteroidia bacterium]